VPETLLMDEISIQRDIRSVKSMKDARNELVRRLAQQNVYFVREFIYRANPPQPFPKLKIKACYYLSRHGPRVHTSIPLHAWCRLCVAFDSLFDSNSDANNHYDECIKKIVTVYANVSSIQTGSRLLTLSQLLELATSLLADNKIIRPSQFEVVSFPQEQQTSNEIEIIRRVVSPQEPEEPALLTGTSLSDSTPQAHSQLQQVHQSQSISTVSEPRVPVVCCGISSSMLYSVLKTNPGMIVQRYSIVAGVIRHNGCSNYLTEGEIRSCTSCCNAQKNLRRERDPELFAVANNIKRQVAPKKEQIANAIRKHYHNTGLDDVSCRDDVEVQWLCSLMALSHPTAISIDLNSAMNLGFCQKATNDCPGFWTTGKDIRGNNGSVLCPRCQDFNRNAAKRQARRDADIGKRTNVHSSVNLRYLSPASTTERLRNANKARRQEIQKKAQLIKEHVSDDRNKEFTDDPDTIEYVRKTLQNVEK
jgi:hypothetical protein